MNRTCINELGMVGRSIDDSGRSRRRGRPEVALIGMVYENLGQFAPDLAQAFGISV